MTKKSDLSFEDFNYEKACAQLPEGYEPIPSLQFKTPTPEKLIKVAGYSSQEEAINRIHELQKLYPSNKYNIVPHNISINDFAIVVPVSCCKYLKKGESIINDMPLISITTYEPFLYRFFDKKEFENNFFNNGELLISTIKRCQSKEIQNRQDVHETQNKIVLKDGKQIIDTVISYDYETLLLCTSLAQENLYNDKCVNEYGFKINKPSEFLDILTRALVTKGIKICEILRGPCVYNNKQITLDATGTNIINNFLNQKEQRIIDIGPTTQYISAQAQNHILMNKPTSYSSENEYRFIWKLSSQITKDSVADDVQINTDGSIIVRVPELVQFCERL